MTRQLLVEMFDEMVIKKDASLVQRYFHPGFVLETDGQRQPLAIFLRRREVDYATAVSYEVTFDDEAWVESATSVSARLWLTRRRPGAMPEVRERLLIARYVGSRIHRMWTLGWPAATRRRASPTPRNLGG